MTISLPLQTRANALDAMSHAVMITDAEGVIVDVNAAFVRITGWPKHAIVGRTPSVLKSGMQDEAFYADLYRTLSESGHWEGEIWNRRRSGESFAELLHIDAVRDGTGALTHYVAVFSDITARKRLERQLERMAHYDPLTGVPNRALFEDRLRQALALAGREGWQVAVAILDLDGFKAINDTHGHLAGDGVLRAVGKRLVGTVRQSDTVARLGGDEFAVLGQGIHDADDLESTGRRLLAAFDAPIAIDGARIAIGASIGIARFPGDAHTPEALIEAADRAMYEAKRAGKHRLVSYPPPPPSKAVRKAPRLSARLGQS